MAVVWGSTWCRTHSAPRQRSIAVLMTAPSPLLGEGEPSARREARESRRGRRSKSNSYLIGGAYWMPPAFHNWFMPRGIFSFDSLPMFRS